MKISNALHHLSIKRGIELLRKTNYNLSAFKRRPQSENEESVATTRAVQLTSEGEVPLWTNHRVMEWLRGIDLSEYVANLRGSGVHGALIVSDMYTQLSPPCTTVTFPTSRVYISAD